MILYLIVAFFPFIVYSLPINTRKPKNAKLIKIIISAFPMFVLIALRAPSLGADTGGYIREFNDMINIPWANIYDNTREEHGFRIFVKLITYLTKNPLIYQIIYTVIYFIGIVSFANNLDFDANWFLFFFVTLGLYIFMFTGVRQCIAMSICLFSYKFIKKRKLIPFLLCIALAFTFHRSSILFLAGYFIYSRKLNYLNIFLYIIIAVVSVFYLEWIQNFFNEQLDYNYTVEETGNGWIFCIFLLILTVFSTFMVIYNKKLGNESLGLFNVGVIANICWILRIFTRIAERPSFYFLFFSCAFLGYSLTAVKDNKDMKIVKTILLLLCTLYYVYRLATSGISKLVPYQFYY